MSSFLREVSFSKKEFFTGKLVSDIKYNHPSSHNNNSFYPFIDQLDYRIANYFANFETKKSNIDRFLSDLLITQLIEKLSY